MTADLSVVINMAFQWLLYPITHWSFTFAGVTLTIAEFFIGCGTLGICVFFIKEIAGANNIHFLNIIFGGENPLSNK